MNTGPLVSIVLPTLNGSRFLAASLQSIVRQTYPHWELIIVDGGSTDGTLAIVDGFNDPRIKVVRQSDNTHRLPGALNAGFAQAAGEYYTWTQDDDYFQPEALAVMVTALAASPAVAMVYTGFHFIDEHGHPLREAEVGPPDGLRRSNVVGHCFLYRRAIAEQVGPYDPAFLMAEDFH